jgi:selenocysteine-specific elongation factor
VTVVIGTAGHIDHGKTTLLRALTGIDADRLPEEQRRGMTIDVGYAHVTLQDGRELDFVDVPGHDRLIGNMLVGAGEIDAVLLVVAADDGPRAQTIEHLELIDGLGIAKGVVAITKTDRVDERRIAAVEEQVQRLLAATRLTGAPIVPVSGATGEGVELLTGVLADLALSLEASHAEGSTSGSAGSTRLAIDRVFTVKGRGAVVTGTLRGVVRRGDRLKLVPGDREVVAREVQVHGHEVEIAAAGRAALNLRGIEAGDLRRGIVLTTDRDVVASDRLLVVLNPPPAFGGSVRETPPDRARLRLHAGTDQVEAKVVRAGRESATLDNGRVTAVLRLDRPIAVAVGDAFVLRRPATHRTDAGGMVLDPWPPTGAARRRATPGRLAALVAAGWPEERDAALLDLHGARVDGHAVRLAPDVAEALNATALERVSAYHAEHASVPGIPVAELRAELGVALRRSVTLSGRMVAEAVSRAVDGLVSDGLLAADGDRIRTPDHRPAVAPGLAEAMDRLESLVAVASPPPLSVAMREAGCPVEGVRDLEREGRIVRLDDDLAWNAETYMQLGRRAVMLARAAPLTPAAFRDATGTSRKYVMAILEDLDRRGILRRTPAGHAPGPREATLDELAPRTVPVAR